MLAPSPVVKATAKTMLKDRYLSTVVASSVFLFLLFTIILTGSLASTFFGNVATVLVLLPLAFFGAAPLFLGMLGYFSRLIFEKKDSVLIMFKYFSSKEEYKRAMHFCFLIGARVLLYAIICYFPCIIVQILASKQLYELFNLSIPLWTSNLWALNSFLAFLGGLTHLFVMLRFYLAPFIFMCNDTICPAEAVTMSTIISKRTGGDFFGLCLSFIGWIILSLFVAPFLFTLPYFATSYCVHCRFAITAYNRDVNNFNAENAPSFSTEEI